MEGKEEGQYQAVITKPAEISFYEILDYLYDQYSIDKAEEIANGLRDKAKELKHQPERGAIEPRLSHRPKDYDLFYISAHRGPTSKYFIT